MTMTVKQIAWQYTKHLSNYCSEHYATAMWFFFVAQIYHDRWNSGWTALRWYMWLVLGPFVVVMKLMETERQRLAKLEEERRMERYRRIGGSI